MIGEILDIVSRTILISLSSLALCSLWSIPSSVLISMRDFKGKRTLLTITSSLVAIPTVTIGLILYMLLSRSGPFGYFDLLFTPFAIVIGEAIFLTPYLITFLSTSLMALGKEIKELAITLGASARQADLKVLQEGINVVLYSLAATFSRGIGELGIALMVGGNLKGFTRVLTTAIALETFKGEFELGLVLSLILILITLSINFLIIFKGYKGGELFGKSI
ncbi:MAG: ABC transporter permease [Nitrososphaerales archaeon]